MSTLFIFIIGMLSGAGLTAGKNSSGELNRMVYIRDGYNSFPFGDDNLIRKHDY
ncbi:hypothetical protein [Chengkuizengella axinellae]|uniref:Uncharacterized protein n=1 Tax=Chengkuizengella axinellae TaxID=3064388 RepID=A0ABT9J4D6_9BACL|nr:hypothetical protein [Chengkuizengella sp. 2205SS18-9]MDP5275804.1 hypothetical protein [Chengkuizengella sp. 2205SS18-9]